MYRALLIIILIAVVSEGTLSRPSAQQYTDWQGQGEASSLSLPSDARWVTVDGSLTHKDGRGIRQGSGAVCRNSDGRPAAVAGFQTFSEPSLGGGDDTALNAVRFLCYAYPSFVDVIIKDDLEGEWGQENEGDQVCENALGGQDMVSAALKMEPPNNDDTGAVNIRMKCRGDAVPKEGADARDWGNWVGSETSCGSDEYICGLRNYVQDQQGDGDDMGMTGIDILCCKGSPPGQHDVEPIQVSNF